MTSIYLIGSLRNWKIVDLANEIQHAGYDVFADWIGAGPKADAFFLKYAKKRGWSYSQALRSAGASNTFKFDKAHIDSSDAVILVMPAGRSGHLELGYARGCGKPGFILFDKEPKRLDIMYGFATEVFLDKISLMQGLKRRLG